MKRALAGLLDIEILLGIAARGTAVLSGFVTILLVGSRLSLVEQGFFFTFISLTTLQVFVELGLTTVVIQFASHERAAAQMATTEAARRAAEGRLWSIGRLAFLWFGVGAALFLVGIGGGGAWFLATTPGGARVAVTSWPLLVVAASLDLALVPAWALLEGVGEVKSVYAYRTARALIQSGTVWVVLLAGGGLWASGVGYVATLVLSTWMILSKHRAFFAQFRWTRAVEAVDWRREMLPMQWRLALTWGSGYLMNSALTPIALRLFGPEEAGRIGMEWTMMGAIIAVAQMPVLVKFQMMGRLVAMKQWAELDRIWLRQALISFGLGVMGGAAGVLLVVGLRHYGLALGSRFLSPGPTAMLMFTTVLMMIPAPMGTYMRAHKRELLLVPSVTGAVVMIVMAIPLGEWLGPIGITTAYLAASLMMVPWAAVIFLRSRRLWHAPGAATAG